MLVAVLDDVMLGILIAGLSTRSLGLFRRGLHVADRAVTRFCGDFVIGVATGSVP